ncbi:MAG: signal recognition particle receptor subunit alpha [Candidatus Aenigmatarchaeota archaeon]
MVLEKIGEGLREALRKIARVGYIDKNVIDELVKDIQRSLLLGDVDVKLVFELTKRIKERALNEKPQPGITPKEHIVNIVYQELVNFVGKKPEIELKPRKIMLIGLFGSGKTTTIGKLAKFYQKRGLRCALIGCDVHRPAAMDQLQQISNLINVPCYAPKDIKDPIEIAKNGIELFEKNYDLLIFDTSGRNALDKELANELKKLGEFIKPNEVLLTIPADIGQAARIQAEEFKKLVGITGIIITKMDGTAKGGGALTACAVTGVQVKWIGVGEKLDALEQFDPERFISRLIGFGDLQSLLEKARDVISEEKAKEITENISKGKLTMDDFLFQLESFQKMGSIKSITEMLPGFSLPKNIDLSKQEEKMKKWKYAIQSMTKKERENPEIIDSSRISRISRGSGVPESEIRDLLKTYEQMKKMIKLTSGKKRGLIGNLMKKFKMFKGLI